MHWHVGVFGTTTLRGPGGPTVPLTRAQRRLLARLALDAGEAVGTPALIDALWDDDPPPNARAALQNQISRIRAAAAPELISTHPAGYCLHATVDADDSKAAVDRAEHAGAAGQHSETFAAAEAACRSIGPGAYADLGDDPRARAERELLATAKVIAENLRLAAGVALGRTGWALVEAQRLATNAPYDATRAIGLAKALDANGRRGDALAALSDHVLRVRRELGIEPAVEIGQEQARLLEARRRPVSGFRTEFVGRDAELDQVGESTLR